MSIVQALLPEFDATMSDTRRVLERIPDDKFAYKPHPKSGSMGWLASHLSQIPLWVVRALQADSFDVAPVGGQPQKTVVLASTAAVLQTFADNVKDAREAIAATGDEKLLQDWTLYAAGQKRFTLPRIAIIRGFALNHSIHHRGQLTVYMRLNDIPVPGLFGPSADER